MPHRTASCLAGRGLRPAHPARCSHAPRPDRVSRNEVRLCPVTTTVRLRSLHLTAVDQHGTDPQRQLSAVLVLGDKPATHLVAVDDVVAMLVALISNLPYRAHGQEIRCKRTGDGMSEVVLSAVNGTLSVAARMPHDRWITTTMDLVKQVAEELTRHGAGQLASPLIAVLDLTGTR